MFLTLEEILLSFIHTLPLEAFVLIASFVEEVIAPIPSPTVMMLAGSFAHAQAFTVYALIPLALIGAVGKTIGALVVYGVSNKAEHFVVRTCGRFFRVTHEDIQKLGSKLGNGVKDYLLLTVFRALPFVPSVVVSVGSGVLKVPLSVFIVSTFVGTIIRDGIYLYAGYVGAGVLIALIHRSTGIETYIEIGVVIVVLIFLGRHFYNKRKDLH